MPNGSPEARWPPCVAALAALALAGCAITTPSARPASAPPRDCTAFVGADRNAELLGYFVQEAGGTVCVPLLVTARRPPNGYVGRAFYIDEFTDAKLDARWRACKADTACFKRIDAQMQRWLAPAGTRPNSEGQADLRRIRRPSFFREAIAESEARTWTVEFTVPRDSFERETLNLHDAVKLRGWYFEGVGVDDGRGGKLRALVIMASGGGGQLTADDPPMRWWRENLQALNQAGFDVLSYDRRGEGLSGGASALHTREQGEDVFRVLEQLESGRGLRMLTPSGELLEGSAAGGRLLAGMTANRLPIVLGGYSRGSMSTAWAMTRNFVDAPQALANIKGAILLSSFASGAGYLPDAPDLADRNLLAGGMAAEHRIVFYPSSATLAGMDRWPAAFFGKGLWDRAESLEGTIAAYDRIPGAKEIVVARGAHSIETWAAADQRRLSERMVAFAKVAVTGGTRVPGARPWSDLRELAATATSP
ncbi:MAG: hypothetical protein EOP82_23865 [Variovorax sp.]|nr:MAG: hypothetical protein EOP82_23865 [Variovorax sp.]